LALTYIFPVQTSICAGYLHSTVKTCYQGNQSNILNMKGPKENLKGKEKNWQ